MRLALALLVCVACGQASVTPPAQEPAAPVQTVAVSTTATPAPKQELDPAQAELYAALDKRDKGDLDGARAALTELIRKHPGSPALADAYVSLGEMAFDQAAKDPSQFKIAESAYEAAVAMPPPANRVYGYAWYKLGWTFFNTGDGARALNAFKKAADFGAQYPQLPGAAQIRREALKDMVVVYAGVGRPSAAWDFFHAIAGDEAKTIEMMLALAESLADAGKTSDVQALYKDLRTRDPAHACTYDVRAKYAPPGSSRTDEERDLKACP